MKTFMPANSFEAPRTVVPVQPADNAGKRRQRGGSALPGIVSIVLKKS